MQWGVQVGLKARPGLGCSLCRKGEHLGCGKLTGWPKKETLRPARSQRRWPGIGGGETRDSERSGAGSQEEPQG